MEAVAQLVGLVCQGSVPVGVLPDFRLMSWENSLMRYNFAGGSDGDQVFLLPPDPRDWLPEGHLAWTVRRSVRELDPGSVPGCLPGARAGQHGVSPGDDGGADRGCRHLRNA